MGINGGRSRQSTVVPYIFQVDFTTKGEQASSLLPKTKIPTPMPYLNPRETIDISPRSLPHWIHSESSYFVTFRLADSIPQKTLRTWISE
jgi:hypothetical protein